jgi:hypothetical protein
LCAGYEEIVKADGPGRPLLRLWYCGDEGELWAMLSNPVRAMTGTASFFTTN